jgi:multidrug efflux pump subunit AcrA (membrane-fusion protein)
MAALGAADPRLLRLTLLLQLERRARNAESIEELRFALVNETHALVPYRQAVLWDEEAKRVTAVSGVATLDRQAPYLQWLDRELPALLARGGGAIDADQPAGRSEWWPACALLLPVERDGRRLGALLLLRDQTFWDGEMQLLAELLEAYARSWSSLRPQRARLNPRVARLGKRRALLVAAAAMLLLGLVPVRESVLAPAEVAPLAPTLVRAPYDGVVAQVQVQPNQSVTAGETLFSLDADKVDADLAVAAAALEVAEAELRQLGSQAFADAQAKAGLAASQGRVEQRRAEVAYLSSLRERLVVTASRAGIVLFDDPNDWLGKPVKTGERVMLLADPAALQLDIRVPASDAPRLDEGGDVTFFPNLAPERAINGRLSRTAYTMSKAPEGFYAYRAKAAIDAADLPRLRLGLKGTAKVYGARVPLGFLLLRRPIGAVRAWLGV